MKNPAVYIVANKKDGVLYIGVLYIGVTSNLNKRIYEHKNSITKGFTHKYNCHSLVYFEFYEEMSCAIEREKILKNRSREYKVKLIEETNPKWNDLYFSLIG